MLNLNIYLCDFNGRSTELLLVKLHIIILRLLSEEKEKVLHEKVEFQDSYNLLQFAHNLKMSTTAHQKITKLNTIRIYSP